MIVPAAQQGDAADRDISSVLLPASSSKPACGFNVRFKSLTFRLRALATSSMAALRSPSSVN